MSWWHDWQAPDPTKFVGRLGRVARGRTAGDKVPPEGDNADSSEKHLEEQPHRARPFAVAPVDGGSRPREDLVLATFSLTGIACHRPKGRRRTEPARRSGADTPSAARDDAPGGQRCLESRCASGL